eukprot:gene14164-2512_t
MHIHADKEWEENAAKEQGRGGRVLKKVKAGKMKQQNLKENEAKEVTKWLEQMKNKGEREEAEARENARGGEH